MSTRGSNDIVITILVLSAFYYLLKRQYFISGLLYGLSVHFKIYPIIYSIPMYLYIDCNKELILKGEKYKALTTNFFTKNRLVFAFTSAFVFLGLMALFY
jgi:phosphatidylinositol glycan class M